MSSTAKTDISSFVTSSQKKSLSKLIEELNEISNLLANEEIEIEKLSFYYEKAIFLKNLCLQRLSSIELEITNLNEN